jgi:hypothetical protein
MKPVLALAMLFSQSVLAAEEPVERPEPESILEIPGSGYAARLHAEIGFLAVLKHNIQFSRSGTRFNYVKQGGQDVLSPFLRFSVDLFLRDSHGLTLLYQPLDIQTREVLRRDVVVDELTFPAGTPVNLRYGFSFWRLSYLYDFDESRETEVAVGGSLQIRNAIIDFESGDGTLRRTNRNVGPVPVIKGKLRLPIGEELWVGAEVDGFWAPIRYFNGGDSDVEGAILDASLRAGLPLMRGIESFLNIRYLGGGAKGTSKNKKGPGDGYVDNWLHFLTVSLGFSVH